ncbi:hypothetical protein EV193_1123 [Herbihabitans rhizosphaerae]|uniref:Uncharacterized protein n=1 Tax=Herbihabitans rhizosphaerae TaxID=1872711 RepID=A0A4Q7KEK3_9PSEU|nr:hypothetical protein [Herbihabitans rhizosphaerae]RZS32370.1 hypothetical protein EV193_1123 [Herbihabitans rhizosphaerae]
MWGAVCAGADDLWAASDVSGVCGAGVVKGHDDTLPSDEWQYTVVHWHAYDEYRGNGCVPSDSAYRARRRPRVALFDPWAVAGWLDKGIRLHVRHRDLYAKVDGMWMPISAADLGEVRRLHMLTASCGESIHTDVYFNGLHHDLFADAMTAKQCTRDCRQS